MMISRREMYISTALLLCQSAFFAGTGLAAEAGRMMELGDSKSARKPSAYEQQQQKKQEEARRAVVAKRAEMKARDKKNMQELKDKVDSHVKKSKSTEKSRY